MANNEKKEVRCSFCGRTQDEVKRLIAGPNAYICNECVDICADLVREEEEDEAAEGRFQLDGKLPKPAEMKAALAEVLKYSLIIVASLPVLVVYPFVQKYFMKGVMLGSVKG